MEVQMMKSVAQTVIPVHKYYYEPVSGKKFRSMPEVLRFLKTGSMRKKSTGGDATILGHLLFMETWFLKAKDKNGMLSSRLCLKGMQIGMQEEASLGTSGLASLRVAQRLAVGSVGPCVNHDRSYVSDTNDRN
ncbi:Methyl-CpG-binding domain-containing protein 5 [Capsicum baccatum]|uniref:Methyl-CpG-binding domain-containing protein 5 n=1 Tax=Capsicum baccatum TaxID=33114 RepID=A0A2G2V3Q3_CAPBA|nr:Methyl-CpG-binding domain-containing protein 5 [Capsicum baccatum]